MAHLTYTNYEGFGERAKENYWYSQAVRIGDTIEISGQGGWDRQTDTIPGDILAQIAAAFDNVEHTLQVAGSKGWEDVYFVRSYFVPMSDEALGKMVGLLKKYCPNHQPCWTALSVPKLARDADGMKVEIEVKAHVEKN